MTEPTITVTLTREEAEGLLTYSRGNPDGDECGPGCDACAARAKLRQALDSPQPERCDGSGYIEQHYGTGQKTARVACPGCSNCQPERYTVEEVAAKLRSRHLAEEVADAWTEGEEGLHPDFVQQLLMSVLDSEEWAEAFPDQQAVEGGGGGAGPSRPRQGESLSRAPENRHASAASTSQPEQEGEAGDWPAGDGWSAPDKAIRAAWAVFERAEGISHPPRNLLALAVSAAFTAVQSAPAQHPTGLSELRKGQPHRPDIDQTDAAGLT